MNCQPSWVSFHYRRPLKQRCGAGQLISSARPLFSLNYWVSYQTNLLNPDTYFVLAAMASWLAYHAWRSLWRVFDSIRRYNFATVFLFDWNKTHRLISSSQPELPSTPSPVCLSATFLGSPHTDNFEATQLPRLYPVFPADGLKGNTLVEYVLCFELKTQTNSYQVSSQFTVLRQSLQKHGSHMSETQT
jgi:hypothetical protein